MVASYMGTDRVMIAFIALLGELDSDVSLIFHVVRTLFCLPVLSNTLPIVDELCKRSARFITSCLLSSNHLVCSISRHSEIFAKYNFLLRRNALVCCSRYDWSSDSFLSNCIQLSNYFLSLVLGQFD